MVDDKQTFSIEDDFFKIGVQKEAKLLAVEQNKDWKDIKPKQDYDAVNRQAWKKRKSDERDKAKEMVADKVNPQKRFKRNFKSTEKEEIINRKRQLLNKIENLIGNESFEIFKQGFRSYKTNPKWTIDEFVKILFKAFLGDSEPVCHLEVSHYVLRKQILIGFEDEVNPRHLDRFTALINTHF